MRLIDADELMEHVWRDKLDSRELIAKMINYAPTIKDIPIKIPINIFEKLISQESCEDCISRQDALNAITMSTERWQAVKHIEELPPVLPQEERTGHWVDWDDGFSACECSECKDAEFTKSNYCPNCGIKMDNPLEVNKG